MWIQQRFVVTPLKPSEGEVLHVRSDRLIGSAFRFAAQAQHANTTECLFLRICLFPNRPDWGVHPRSARVILRFLLTGMQPCRNAQAPA
ncbi:hypothetical protein D3C74_234520 [compost metagenome]